MLGTIVVLQSYHCKYWELRHWTIVPLILFSGTVHLGLRQNRVSGSVQIDILLIRRPAYSRLLQQPREMLVGSLLRAPGTERRVITCDAEIVPHRSKYN